MAKQAFILKVSGKDVPLKWGTYAMMLFTKYRKQTLAEFFDMLAEQADGKYTIADVVLFLRCAAEYASEGNEAFKDIEIAEWVDELGGASIHKGQLSDFFTYVIENTLVNVTPLDGEGQKKTETELSTTPPGTTS